MCDLKDPEYRRRHLSFVTLACSRTSLLWHLLQNLTLAPEIKWSANPSDGDKVKSFKNADVWGFCIWLPRRHYRGAGERGQTILHLLETHRSLVFAAAEESPWAHFGERRIDQTRTLFLPDKDIFASYLPGLFTFPTLCAMQQADSEDKRKHAAAGTECLCVSFKVYASWSCVSTGLYDEKNNSIETVSPSFKAKYEQQQCRVKPELYICIHIYDYIQFIQWMNK